MATGFWKKRRLPLVGSLLVAAAIVPYLLGRGMSHWNMGQDPGTALRVVLAVPPDVLDLGDIDFEESLIAGEPFTPRTVRGWCDVRLDAVQAETSPSLGTAVATVDPERPHEFDVTFTPGDRQPGDLQGVVTLRGVAEDGRRLVPGGLRVVARVLHPVRVGRPASPSTVVSGGDS